MQIVFFGSFQHYSTLVLEELREHFDISAVITTPPKPKGRHHVATETDVAQYSKKEHITVFELDTLLSIPSRISRPDFLVVAGYGNRIPPVWLAFPKIMPINMHPSLLPQYRGAFPAEWAILRGETKTGVTILKMSEEFDRGDIISQQKIAIAPTDTRETLYDTLYRLGADLLVDTLTKQEFHPVPQPKGDYFYARRLTREDGFVPWEKFDIHSKKLETKLRALVPWPGVWTRNPEGKRLKLIQLHPTPIVQLEGKKPVSLAQFAKSFPVAS